MQKDEDGGAELGCEESPMNLCLLKGSLYLKLYKLFVVVVANLAP